MMRLFSILVWLLLSTPALGGLSDCIDATCRVRTADGTMGTGCVFEISQGTVFVLTNRHVVARASSVDCVFWRFGHQSTPIAGQVSAVAAEADVALVAVPVTSFGALLPQAVPIAPRGTQLRPGQTITSVGCAKGAWATGWKGHVVGYEQPNLVFTPPPAGGRSGSAIFDAAGERIVGLVWGRNDQDGTGYAVSLENIYRALTFRQTTAGWQHRPDAALTQCGPNGCPIGSANGSANGWPPISIIPPLPYRQYERWKGEQRDQRVDRLEDRVDRTWPTLPPGGGGQPSLPGRPGDGDGLASVHAHLAQQDRRLDAIAEAVDAQIDGVKEQLDESQSGLAEKITRGLGGSLGALVLGKLKWLLGLLGVGGSLLGGVVVWVGVRVLRSHAHAISGAVDRVTDVIPGTWDDAIIDPIAKKVADLVGTDTAKTARAEARKVARAATAKKAKR